MTPWQSLCNLHTVQDNLSLMLNNKNNCTGIMVKLQLKINGGSDDTFSI